MSTENPTLIRCINPRTGQVKYFPLNVVNDHAIFGRTGFQVQPVKAPVIEEPEVAPPPVEKNGAQVPIEPPKLVQTNEGMETPVRSIEMQWRKAVSQILRMTTEQQVMNFILGDSRETVIREAEARIEKIKQSNNQ